MIRSTLLLGLLWACTCVLYAQPTNEFVLNIHESNDPDGLNPITSKAANAEDIQDNIFCRLLDYNRETFKLEPVLAVGLPEVELLKKGPFKGGMALRYEIHPEAKWDNGNPVTGYDYHFTIKAAQHKGVESSKRASMAFIKKIEVDPTNPKVFTVYSDMVSVNAQLISGQLLPVMPEYIYDPNQFLRKITIAELLGSYSDYPESVQEFADDFNAYTYSSEVDYIEGCGPYQLVEWESGDYLRLERKTPWWGDQVTNNIYLKAYPTTLMYRIIPGNNWQFSKLESGELDIVRNVVPERFYEAKNDPFYQKTVSFHDPSQFAYHYLAFNAQNPKLSDKRVREAIACAIDRDRIVNEFFSGGAMKVNTPVSPHRMYYNINISGVEFDLEKAAQLLDKAGWKDTDGDDIRDKKIDGKVVKLRLKYNYNKNNTVRKAIGKMLKANLTKIGIKMDLYPIDFPMLLQRARAREYEVMALAWVNSPGSDDLRNVWHSSSNTEDGGNRIDFGTPRTDKLLDQIAVTLDEEVRKKLYLELQERIAAEYPYAFLVVPNQLVMIRKGLSYPRLSPINPGYVARWFQKQ